MTLRILFFLRGRCSVPTGLPVPGTTAASSSTSSRGTFCIAALRKMISCRDRRGAFMPAIMASVGLAAHSASVIPEVIRMRRWYSCSRDRVRPFVGWACLNASAIASIARSNEQSNHSPHRWKPRSFMCAIHSTSLAGKRVDSWWKCRTSRTGEPVCRTASLFTRLEVRPTLYGPLSGPMTYTKSFIPFGSQSHCESVNPANRKVGLGQADSPDANSPFDGAPMSAAITVQQRLTFKLSTRKDSP